MIYKYKDKKPKAEKIAFDAPNCAIIGEVAIGEGASVWFGATIRADVAPVTIGKNTNIQDNATVHVSHGNPTVIGDEVTVGHNAVVHGCTIGNRCLIGMGAVVLDQAVIGDGSVVGAGALVTQGKRFPPRSLIVGSPAKAVALISDDQYEKLIESAQTYVTLAIETAVSM
ncbi:MAG: gamma carbonic anhydrase family protein [Calditrichaeota bacterium]|nr:MAG: gamma carbonic anhydrase family protein [Calditrichota bacterium]